MFIEQRLFRGYEFLSVGMNLFRGHEFYVVGTTFISWLRTIFRGNDFYFINMTKIKKKYLKHICHKAATVNWQEMLKK